jgi:lysophospholipid acyltransferase (LPLAT)-like uncharacterized protein
MSAARRAAPPRPSTELSRQMRYAWGGRIGAALVRVWGLTLRIRRDVPASVRELESQGHHMIHAFWHAHILTLAYTHRGRGIVVLVSQHGDGEYITQIIHRLGYGTVRGSSSRGGLRSLLEMGRLGRIGHPLGVTPDGPRGPRHALQPGVLLIAQRSGLPIVPLATGARPCRYLKSWDRFELPHPFSRVLVVEGEPIVIPQDIPTARLLEEWGPKVDEAIEAVEERARRWAGGELAP